MYRTTVVIIGAGQAGLAVSNLLTAASVDHVILESARTAESWRSRRWDSLKLLTPNWLTRLPGWAYRGRDPQGFMSASAVADYLAGYAASFDAPVVTGAEVRSVHERGGRFVVHTAVGSWSAASVVVATGYCAAPRVPHVAAELDPSLRQITPDRYRAPSDVPDGQVLVVGASATGVQLADELTRAGRDVALAVGRHTRVPRTYRGLDIMWWLDSLGLLDLQAAPGEGRRPEERSLQLIGSDTNREVDLASLAGRGVELVGRLEGVSNGVLKMADDLADVCGPADAKLFGLLERIDDFAHGNGLDQELEPPSRPVAAPSSGPSRTQLRTGRHGVRTILWATGYRRDYPWLHLPVLDSAGDIDHVAGRTSVPGLVVVGMAWQTRRNSTFIDGVRYDAACVVDHLLCDVLGAMSRRGA